MFQTESQQVTRLKRVVLLIMLLAAVAVSTVVYFITKNAETTRFEAMYEGSADKLLGRLHLGCGATTISVGSRLTNLCYALQLLFRKLLEPVLGRSVR